MTTHFHTTLSFITYLLIVFLFSTSAIAKHNWIFSSVDTPVSLDSHGYLEGTQTIAPYKWHQKLRSNIFYSEGEKNLSKIQIQTMLGFGLPYKFELSMSLPLEYTLAAPLPDGNTGIGLGDLKVGLLKNIKSSPKGGFGLLAGILMTVPTGNHTKSMGEGNFSVLPFLSTSMTVFSSALTINAGYRFRPSRTIRLKNHPIEQDDELVWRVGIRIPKEEDIAWSLYSFGTIGVATTQNGFPNRTQRPIWFGGSVDFPSKNDSRLALAFAFMVTEHTKATNISLQISRRSKNQDEDFDGILLRHDKCPLLREDLDGFEDEDGCPDLDNDKDGFPDKEDKCPTIKADEFSDDGCES